MIPFAFRFLLLEMPSNIWILIHEGLERHNGVFMLKAGRSMSPCHIYAAVQSSWTQWIEQNDETHLTEVSRRSVEIQMKSFMNIQIVACAIWRKSRSFFTRVKKNTFAMVSVCFCDVQSLKIICSETVTTVIYLKPGLRASCGASNKFPTKLSFCRKNEAEEMRKRLSATFIVSRGQTKIFFRIWPHAANTFTLLGWAFSLRNLTVFCPLTKAEIAVFFFHECGVLYTTQPWVSS